MKIVVYACILILVILHQDFWWWNTDRPYVLGFIPIGLAHHGGISLASAAVAALAVRFCWPAHVDTFDGTEQSSSRPEHHE